MARPSTPRNSAGQFTHHLGIRAHLNLEGRPPMAEVIATENLIVRDEALNIDRQLIAGQPVPPDLVDAYRARVGDGQAAQSPGAAARADTDGGSADGLDYGGQTVEELQAEAERRGLEITGTGAGGKVVKGDLVTALQGADRG
jgi:hypothetical protein